MDLDDDFGDLFEEAPIPYVHETMESRFIRANRAARSLLGIRQDEVDQTLGKSLVAKTAESQQQLRVALDCLRQGGVSVAIVLELHRKDDGRSVWVEWSSNPAPNGLYTRSVLVDITQRVLIEQTKAALEFSLESGQVGDWDLDLLHDTSRRSLRHDRCFGYSQPIPDHQWGAVTFIRHVHPDDRDRVESSMQQAVQTLRDWGAEFRVIWPDGSQHWLVAKGNIYRTTDEGVASRMLGVVMDITERKRTEEALAASEQLARGQVDALTRTIESLVLESDPERLLGHVLQTIIDTFGAQSCSVWRVDPGDGRMTLESTHETGRPVSPVDAVRPTLTMLSSTPNLFRRLDEIDDENERARLTRMGITSLLMVPMVLAGRLDGAVGIQFALGNTLRDQDVDLAQALVNQAMFAMQLSKLSAQSREAAVVAERNRMAREIHDTLAQGLTGVIVQLEAAADAQTRGLAAESDRHIARANGLARESLTEARRSVRALRPRELDAGNLCDALDALLQRMTAGTSVVAEFRVEGTPVMQLASWEDNVLRAVKEVLTNVLRHADARSFKVIINFSPRWIRLDLRDDGRGFDTTGKYDGFGLLGVRERIESMLGSMQLDSGAGRGTHYAISLPPQAMRPAAG